MRGRLAHLLAGISLAFAGAAGCGGASPQSGITAYLRLTNAQFVPGAALSPDNSANDGGAGPQLGGVNLSNTTFAAGAQDLPLSGDVINGSSVLIGLDDDSGYWIVPAAIVDVQTTGGFQFSTRMAFAPETPTGKHNLVLRGVDEHGIGPAQKFVLAVTGGVGPVQPFPLGNGPTIPAGSLVFTLLWDTNADLDLHVVVPNPTPKPDGSPGDPIEVWSKAAVGVPRGQGIPKPTADQLAAAPYLDRDSNAGCVIDGARQEDVIFPATATPPTGEYIVRVDAFSMCGQTAAQWEVIVTDANPNDPQVNPATWEATDADTRGDHVAGSGRLALDFNYPPN